MEEESEQRQREADVLLGDLRFKKEQLKQKLKQLKILLEMNAGQLPQEYISWAQNEEVQQHSSDIIALRHREEDLLS